MLRDNSFLDPFIKIGVPIALQNLFIASLGIVDTIMVGQLGDTSIAAVGLASQIAFLMTFTLFGIHTGAAIFTAQYWGNQDIPGIRRVLGTCLTFGLIVCLVFSIIALGFPTQALSIYTHDPAVIHLGSDYLYFVGLSYLATTLIACYTSTLRSINRVRVPVMIGITTLCLKTLLNYLLIFGHLGLPQLGVRGAAWATTLTQWIECLVLLVYVYASRCAAAARIKELLAFNRRFLGVYLGVAFPVFINELLWSIGSSMYNAIYARIGTESVAAVSIALTIINLAGVIFAGISTACGIMVGNAIGAGDSSKALLIARRSLTIAGLLALVIFGVLLAVRSPAINLYRLSPLAHQQAYNVLTVLSFVIFFRAFNPTIIVGILRSGGDTRFSAILDVSAVWLVGVPLASLLAFVFHLPIQWVVIGVLGEGLFKSSIGLYRVASGKWIHNLTHTSRA
ncbi:MAG TPA: MATE family efflux transporter [Anaerolineaceae bacterium]